MTRHHGVVLVDANVIIEAYRTQTWSALAGGYRIETVAECVAETQTGFQLRRQEQLIDQSELRDSLTAIHQPVDRDRLNLTAKHPDISLDEGEAALWAHAVDRVDDWILCGPDKASLRFGCKLGFRERLVSMEVLLKDVGVTRQLALRDAYTESSHQRFLRTITLQR